MAGLDPGWAALKKRCKSGIGHVQSTVREEDIEDLDRIGKWLVANSDITGVKNNTPYAIIKAAGEKFKTAFVEMAKEGTEIARW